MVNKNRRVRQWSSDGGRSSCGFCESSPAAIVFTVKSNKNEMQQVADKKKKVRPMPRFSDDEVTEGGAPAVFMYGRSLCQEGRHLTSPHYWSGAAVNVDGLEGRGQ